MGGGIRMKEILKNKLESLQMEHNRISNALAELKQNFDTLNNRRIELEGAMKEILEILNMKVKENDTESETQQRTDTNEGEHK